MPLPAPLLANLRLPVIMAPLFVISNPAMVIAAAKAGIIGTFPTLNARSPEILEGWMEEITAALGPDDAAWGANLILHKTNNRRDADLALILKHKPKLVITSVGDPAPVVEAVHDYGGVVFHDVLSFKHAAKAAAAGVDGLIAVCAGAGGHGGTISPFTFIPALKAKYNCTIIAAGAIGDGRAMRAAEMLGADACYMGTRFLASTECSIDPAYKQMMISEDADGLLYTDKISGIPGYFLKESLKAAGRDPMTGLPAADAEAIGFKRPWLDIWSAGQGISTIHDAPTIARIVDRLAGEYHNSKLQ